ncbi:MAG: hypothetical protein QF734_04350, partial [Arenicellales bacterium]|nr:hypothetical protein [Arenicellales bacterium]
MRNHTPWWKWLIIAVVIVPGAFYALPNLFGDDPGIQLRGARGGTLSTAEFSQIETALVAGGIPPRSAVLDDRGIRLRFDSLDEQLRARDLLEGTLNDSYTVALTLLPAAPTWITDIGALPMYLGLDLRGGVHFLLEVDMDNAVHRAEERYVSDLRSALREGKVRYRSIKREPNGGLSIVLRDSEQADDTARIVRRELPGLILDDSQGAEGVLLARLSDEEKQNLSKFALEQNITALRNRIDELGVAEPVVQRQGDRRIVVQLPGVQDTARAKRILGRTATLE